MGAILWIIIFIFINFLICSIVNRDNKCPKCHKKNKMILMYPNPDDATEFYNAKEYIYKCSSCGKEVRYPADKGGGKRISDTYFRYMLKMMKSLGIH